MKIVKNQSMTYTFECIHLNVYISLCVYRSKVAWKRNTLIAHWPRILDPRSHLGKRKRHCPSLLTPTRVLKRLWAGLRSDEDQEREEQIVFLLPEKTNLYEFGMFHSKWVEKAMAPHSSTLAWKIPWTEEPGRLQSMLRVRHDWATSLSLFTFMHWRRKWQPTPVFLPGESKGRGTLVGCRLWGCTESDTTEVT